MQIKTSGADALRAQDRRRERVLELGITNNRSGDGPGSHRHSAARGDFH
jgi:hypothetical protein